jgi:hypothetical protein
MTVSSSRLVRCIAFFLATVLVIPTSEAVTEDLRNPELARGAPSHGRLQESPEHQNSLLAVVSLHNALAFPDQTSDQNRPVVPDKSTAAQQQNTPPSPVGTAVAPYEKPEGAPASRPAGAAIAPAKQRRVKSFAIRTALVVGAGVAIGVVVAASLGSSSRPH